MLQLASIEDWVDQSSRRFKAHNTPDVPKYPAAKNAGAPKHPNTILPYQNTIVGHDR